MSLPMHTTCTCAVCGKESKQIVLASTNRFGAPDLDLRPPEMMRSTMCWWIQECPNCGYISESLDDSTSIDESWLRSEKFISVDGLSFKSDLAKRFYKYYLINIADDNPKDAFYAILHSAWGCDDANDSDNAISCRKLAIEQLDILISMINNDSERTEENDEDDDEDATENYRVMRMDLLRRSGQFSRVIEEYTEAIFSSELLNQIKEFQIKHSKQSDAGCYTVTDCTNE